jgi:hypothetical protein
MLAKSHHKARKWSPLPKRTAKKKAKPKEKPPEEVVREKRDVKSLCTVVKSVITVGRWADTSDEEEQTEEEKEWERIKANQEISRLTRIAGMQRERVREAKLALVLQQVHKNNRVIFGKIAESEDGDTDWAGYSKKIEEKLQDAAVKRQAQAALSKKREEGRKHAPQLLYLD